jgi:hypothetical protein
MTHKRNFRTFLLLQLRRLGWLCKKPTEPVVRLRIARTTWPDDRTTSIESERHVWVELKKAGRKNCQFDSKTMSCPCGIKSVEQFVKGCVK